jgi:hypothetical protein
LLSEAQSSFEYSAYGRTVPAHGCNWQSAGYLLFATLHRCGDLLLIESRLMLSEQVCTLSHKTRLLPENNGSCKTAEQEGPRLAERY